MPSTDLGSQLARMRRRRGLSQQQLADLLCQISGSCTVSRNEISRWERGRRVPAQPWLGWLCVVLGQPFDRPPGPTASPGGDRQSSRRWRAVRAQLAIARAPRVHSGVWMVIPEVGGLPTID